MSGDNQRETTQEVCCLAAEYLHQCTAPKESKICTRQHQLGHCTSVSSAEFYITKMSTRLKFSSHQRTMVQWKKTSVLSLNSWGCWWVSHERSRLLMCVPSQLCWGSSYAKVSFFCECTKMQLITSQNFNIQTCFSQFLWYFILKCWFKGQKISRIHLSLPNAYKLMCLGRNINGNRDVKFLWCD